MIRSHAFLGPKCMAAYHFGDLVMRVTAAGGEDRKDRTCGWPERQQWAVAPQRLTVSYQGDVKFTLCGRHYV
jgi:hypothetical protein